MAMGILSTKFKAPLHQYDVWKEELITFNNREFPGIEELVEKRKINLTLDNIISMWGGSINYRQQKVVKSQMDDSGFKEDFEKLWSIAGRDSKRWNGLSGVLKKLLNREDEERNVLALEGNIPVFSSCKNGKVNQMSLYELETVARRFGGRYVRREMIAGQKMTEGYEVRAEEMGIQVIYV